MGDVLDKVELQRQFLPPAAKPIAAEMVILGRAMPVLEADVFAESVPGRRPLAAKPLGMMDGVRFDRVT